MSRKIYVNNDKSRLKSYGSLLLYLFSLYLYLLIFDSKKILFA